MRSESEAEDEARRSRASLTSVPGIGDVTAELLYQNGFKSPEEVAQADEQSLLDVEGLGPDKVGSILKAVREYVETKRQEEAAAAAEADAEEPSAASADTVAPEEG
ncbi:MAG TPA: helix-hairpin-helix domain-containing protein [Candidatus Acidoferrales bacterium]|nr:helix-hairpin-helix domain-containing protein [Candidatus Acidoferrales bacterium]